MNWDALGALGEIVGAAAVALAGRDQRLTVRPPASEESECGPLNNGECRSRTPTMTSPDPECEESESMRRAIWLPLNRSPRASDRAPPFGPWRLPSASEDSQDGIGHL